MAGKLMQRKRALGVMAVSLGLLLLLAVNISSNTALRGFRVDLTDDKLFTLSSGTKSLLGSLEEPIRLRLYLTQSLANQYQPIQDYSRRVRDLLAEYVADSDGKVTLELVNPEPFSDQEDDAVAYGLRGVPVDAAGDKLYFGLVGTNTVDDRSIIEFFSQERDAFLEYDLTRLIYEIATEKKPVVGVVSSLNMFGGPGDLQRGEPAQLPPWTVIAQLEQMFDVRLVGLNEINNELDMLLVVHPRDLSPLGRYSIDQYVLGGGRAVIFVDPLSEEGARNPDPENPLNPQGSNLPELLAAWGVEMDSGMIVADGAAAQRVQTTSNGRSIVIPYLPWLAFEAANFNQDEIATSQLGRITVRSAGHLKRIQDVGTDFIPLIQTSTNTMLLERFKVQFGGDPKRLLDGFVPEGASRTVAVRISGEVDTAFPEGPPSEEGEQSEEVMPPSSHLAQSKGPINVAIIADSDILVDSSWVQSQQFLDQVLAIPMADNGALVANLIELFGGGPELIGLRTRGTGQRPFVVVDKLQRQAEIKFRETERGLQQRMEETERKLSEMRRSEGDSVELLTDEQSVAIEAFKVDLLTIRKELRDVRHELRKDIEGLGTLLKVLNIGGIPVLVGIVALLVFLVRRRRRLRSLGVH
ncbi:MAG: GldG family protein [Pseudomonadota bacterium]|nr:GldG family protein [Pseudomonadota bacterium]